jgi:hypothetical protein
LAQDQLPAFTVRMVGLWWILNWGLGADSTAFLLRLFELLEHCADRGLTGADRDAYLAERLALPGFRLERFVVFVAMVGSEWPLTIAYGQRYILPEMRRWRIRLVQAARAGRFKAEGVTVLDDSASPQRLHAAGHYRLFEEMQAGGTVPQRGGARKCSQRSKGVPGDWVIPHVITRGAPYIQIMGYEADEQGRCTNDAEAGDGPLRTGAYPLRDWGWTREIAQDYIASRIGVRYPKSACTFCPFALSNKAGRERVLAGFADAPDLAWEPLVLETAAQALNPAQTLIRDGSLYDLLTETPGQEDTIQRFEHRLSQQPWALVEVRRVYTGPANAPRFTKVVGEGSRERVTRALTLAAERLNLAVDLSTPRLPRVWMLRRPDGSSLGPERLYTAVPAGVMTKTGRGFDKAWSRKVGPTGDLLPAA